VVHWKAEDLSFLHVLLVWSLALTSLLIKKRQSWTIHQKPSLPEISGNRPQRDIRVGLNIPQSLFLAIFAVVSDRRTEARLTATFLVLRLYCSAQNLGRYGGVIVALS